MEVTGQWMCKLRPLMMWGGADGADGDSGPMPGARLHRKGVMVNGSGPEWSQYHGQGYGAG